MRLTVRPGDIVTLQYQKTDLMVAFIVFALLKQGTPEPVDVQRSLGDVIRFTFWTVKVGDNGSYRCVYYQINAPFWASQPSNSLDLWVTGLTVTEGNDGC
ncbi:T-cell-interacting, activating receptor on myeloid cells protein 1 [Vulpes lagopus]